MGLCRNDEDLNRGKKRSLSLSKSRLFNGESNPKLPYINRFKLGGYLRMEEGEEEILCTEREFSYMLFIR